MVRSFFKKRHFFLLIVFGALKLANAQRISVKGKVADALTNEYISNAKLQILGTNTYTFTDNLGVFFLRSKQVPFGKHILEVSKENYITKRYPIVIEKNNILDLPDIPLTYDISKGQDQIGLISLPVNDIDDNNQLFNAFGLLQSSKDVFLKAAAFDFSTAFFRPRGLGSENSKVLINGIEMNKFYNGRPQWSNWGGLNDMQRNQEFYNGLSANEYSFGGISGTTNVTMRASHYSKGARISYASANRSYRGRIMGSYSSGLLTNGWAYAMSLSRRYGNEGSIEGTSYEANSLFVSVEKKVNRRHSININGFYTPNKRGMSTALTKEVFDLRGRNYNPNWGYFDGEKKSARTRRVEEPIFMLNHYWSISDKVDLSTTIAFQTGGVGSSRLDFGGTDLIANEGGEEIYIGGGTSRDTNPIHSSYLPSAYLQEANPSPLDFQNAFQAKQNFIQNGQLDWNMLIDANQLGAKQGANASYIRYEDRNEDQLWMFNSILNGRLSDHVSIQTAMNYRKLKSENFAEVTDLLGGLGFLDIDAFAFNGIDHSNAENANRAQSDLQNRNRIVREGDRFDYNYTIEAENFSSFIQTQIQLNRINFFLSSSFFLTSYQRTGIFENGYFPGVASFGKGVQQNFYNYGIKGGLTYKINGRHFVESNIAFLTRAPTLQNTYVNPRYNHLTISEINYDTQESEKVFGFDISYIARTPKIQARMTAYFNKIADATDVSFFFTQSFRGGGSGFAQEVLTEVEKLHLGGELGIEYQITPSVKLKMAGALGQFTYHNNPELTLIGTTSDINGILPLGVASLKGYRLSQGPERVGQLGFEYRDPDFWWIGATANYFSHGFIDISSLKRSSNFNQDTDGLPFNDYDPEIAKTLLKQEQLDDYYLINLVGGKSWRIKEYTISVFAVINNVLNAIYKTGGFEQERFTNYRLALEESKKETPVFGPRYFYGLGASYFINASIKF